MEEQSNAVSQIKTEVSHFQDHDPISFDFTLPVSQFAGDDHPTIDLYNLSRPPNADECRTLAHESNGDSKRLNPDQLRQLRQEGKVIVPSEAVPGQNHEWQVSKLLQKGVKPTNEAFFDDWSVGCGQWIVSIPNRVYRGDYITIKDGLKNMGKSLLDIPILLFGWIAKNKKNSEHSIDQLMEQFVLHKLVEHILGDQTNVVPEDSYAVTSQGNVEIKLVLDKKNQIVDKLANPVRDFNVQWQQSALERRQGLYNQLQESDLTEDKKITAVLEKENKLYQTEICRLIKTHLDGDDSESLNSLIKSLNIYKKYMKKFNDRKAVELADFMADLEKKHNVMKRVPDWVILKRAKFLNRWESMNPISSVHDAISEKLEGQEKFLFDLNRSIRESDEYKSEKARLIGETVPAQSFTFEYRIWRPSHWKITHTNGYYQADQYNRATVTTNYPLWRLANIGMRTAKYFNNGNFYLCVNLIQGKFSLRSLVGLDEFHTGVEVNSQTGQSEKTMPNATWFGRIRSLWQHIAESRRAFEAAPDTSVIGKSISRIFNVIWNYGIKGVLGTTLCFLGHPLLVIGSTIGSIAGIVTSPVWAPLTALLKYICDILFYDMDCPYSEQTSFFQLLYIVIWKFCLLGMGQTVLSLLGMAWHGFAGFVVFLWALVSNGMRYAYDATIYHLILKFKGKVPSEDGFLVRRIAGPGLSNSYFYLIDHKLALVMLEYQLEKLEMTAFTDQTRQRIGEPLKEVLNYYEQFREVGLTPNEGAVPIKGFAETKKQLNDKLDDITRKYWDSHHIKNTMNNRDKVKMTRNDLVVAMERGTGLCRDFFTHNIAPRFGSNEDELKFWSSKNLSPGDFMGLTKYCYETLFNGTITVPIEETDAGGFHLTIHEQHTGAFIKDLFDGEPEDGLQHVSVVNPGPVNKLMETRSTAILPQDLFADRDAATMTLNKDMIEKHKKYLDEKKKTEPLNFNGMEEL